MKVSAIWRMVSIFLLGVLLGMAMGIFGTIRAVQNNMKPSQSIEIGNVKIKSKKDSQVDVNFDTQQDDASQTDNSKKKRLFGRKK